MWIVYDVPYTIFDVNGIRYEEVYWDRAKGCFVSEEVEITPDRVISLCHPAISCKLLNKKDYLQMWTHCALYSLDDLRRIS